MRGFVSIALWLCASKLSLGAPGSSFNTVKTENGLITGHHSPNVKNVWEYLGIPYAQPPLGDLRFAAPQKYKTKAPYNATTFGYDCPQQAAVQPLSSGFTPQAARVLGSFTGAAGTQRNEDCLTLNIWSKQRARSSKADKPVFVLFHGGRFAGGNTNTPFANGQYLANSEDLIVVTVNYRLNVFGFPGAPDADTNLGLRDQRHAVEWLQKNIAAFGGSPKKIVIAGQSSGGAAVDWWSYAYRRNPIAHGLMSTSGNAFSFPMNTPQKQKDNWYQLSALLGCVAKNETLKCMREQPWQAVSSAVSKISPSPGGSPVRSTPPFYPMIDNKIIFGDYLSLASLGSFAKIPYFHGHNNYEQGYYVIPAFAQGRNVTEEQAAKFLLESFVCPHSYEARQRVKAKVPNWVYRYFGDWNNTRLYPTSGAYHGTELHMILGGSQDASGLPASQAQKDTSKLFQRAVAAFADNPKRGLAKFGWPQYDPNTNSWIEIAVANKPKATFAKPEKYDKACSKIVMGALSTLS
ncbi:carboxylesteras-like protein [Cucurbitaria berberidis CBS 394.84]|uniref:Carboxylic ester hydrolase n=1 Tax=Cucurbitaria berberidis CBS 394.84 TaxID=1168544 RepID=A0A9P4GM66_9PLEO|nr:carboxylesteras-like protein [Cucurbitaria berberidis CBS 394.84]KAF1847616.1 carboxylesteras-like protein [Cucurbitaria berberidis CBS 394.84]